jgi:hypothetical protein
MTTIATQWAQEGLDQFTEFNTSITAALRFVFFGRYDHYFECYLGILYDSVHLCFFSYLGTKSARTDPRSQGPTKCLKIHRDLRINTGHINPRYIKKEKKKKKVQSSPPVTITQFGRKLELKSAHS